MIIQGVLVCLLGKCSFAKKFKTIREFTDSLAYKQAVNRFLLETLFEIVICVAIAFKAFEIREIWGTPDYVAVVAQMICLVVTVIFFINSFYFLLFKQPKMIEKKNKALKVYHEEVINEAKELHLSRKQPDEGKLKVINTLTKSIRQKVLREKRRQTALKQLEEVEHESY